MAKEITFKLKAGSVEFPARFGGQEVRYTVPTSLEEIRALAAEGVDSDEVIVAGFVGQGYSLATQKRIKDALASEAVEKIEDVDEALAYAVKVASDYRLGAPRAKGEGKKSSKTAAAEARAAQAEEKLGSAGEKLLESFAGMNKSMQGALRAQLLATGLVTEEQLQAVSK